MKRPLDRIDSEILAALQNDARISNKQLAARVGLATSSCFERVKRLWADGVLRAIHAEVDPKAVGVGLQALIMVRLRQHAHELLDSFHDYVLSLRETVALYHVGGAHDYHVHVAVRDSDHLRDVALQLTRRDEIAQIETSLIFEYRRTGVMPIYGRD